METTKKVSVLEGLAATVAAVDFKEVQAKGWNENAANAVSAYYIEARKTQDNKKILSYLSIETGLTVPSLRGKLNSLKHYQVEEKAASKPARTTKATIVRNIESALFAATGTKPSLDSFDKANSADLNELLDSLIKLSEKREVEAK